MLCILEAKCVYYKCVDLLGKKKRNSAGQKERNTSWDEFALLISGDEFKIY